MIVDPYFLDHWKVKTLAGLLGKDEKAPLYILRLWAYCQTSKKTSIPNNADVIAQVCCFKGHGETLLNAFLECKVLDRNEDETLEVHGFTEWNASLIALRKNAQKATAARLARHQDGHQRRPQRSLQDGDLDGEQRRGGLDRIGLDNTPKPPSGACEGWVSEFFDALVATGKIPALKIEHLQILHRDYPMAALPKNWRDVVEDVAGLAGVAGHTMAVLRKSVSSMEARRTGGFRRDATEDSGFTRPDLPEGT